MRSFIPLIIAVLLGYSLSYLQPSATTAANPGVAPAAAIRSYFSPSGGCTDAIVAELATAKTSVDVQAYSFTSAPIAKALVDAKDRGVKLRVILDKSQETEKYSSLTFLRNA